MEGKLTGDTFGSHAHANNKNPADPKDRTLAGKQSEPKMKVQSLLNKLQIKVDRV
jgi:hypothetical protein